jgi:DNA-binding protein HU-beta
MAFEGSSARALLFTFDKWLSSPHYRVNVTKGLEMTEAKSSRDELIEKIATLKGANQKDAKDSLTAVLDGMTALLKEGKKLTFVGWGSFEVQERKATQGRNPRTGETIEIPASKRVVFKVGSKLKDAVNGKD